MMFSPGYFKSDNGKTRTKSLFYELSYTDPGSAIFTLKDEDLEKDGKIYISLKKLYLSLAPADPTEYDFAQTVFGSWETWQAIANSPYLTSWIGACRREMEVKVKSTAIKALAEEMRSGGRAAFGAAKLLLEKGWIDKEPASLAKRKLAAKEDEDTNKQAMALFSQDAERLGLKVQ